MSPVIHNIDGIASPDTLVGTDSHTPHVDALGVIAVGVGGLEAENVMLGNPSYMRVPEIIGVEITGTRGAGITATDIALSLTSFLRDNNVISAYLEFYGKGENTSMIKSPVITGQGFTYDGNLVIECDSHVEKNQWWENFHVLNGAYFTKMGDSKVIIDVCTGIKNGGNEGGDPEDPKFPIIMDDNRNYAYLFEDQWPLYGDYDMNDLVLIIKERKISINKSNKAEEFTLSLDLSAAGATKSIGAAIMLDGVPASAITQPVEFSDNSLFKGFNVNSNLIENGQDYAVIPLFDDAHKALGRDRYEQINTIAGHSANTSPKNISFTIKFSNPISVDELNINKLNVFIFVEGNRNQRKEIHIVGYQPTKLANTDLFGGNNDDSSTSRKRYYISKDNLAWGIMVPTDFKWPLEYVNIKSAYSLFESWVTSGGTKNEEWWKTFDSSRVYK
jgi:LruC domain-containing protein